MAYLFDASSLVKALKLRRADLLAKNYIQWLTIYEVLNALWKEVHLLKAIPEDRMMEFAKVLRQITDFMNVLEIKGLEEEVLRVAMQLGITAYDSSYIVLAREHELSLVTEDDKLRAKAEGLVRCVSIEGLIP